jgi:isoaspartyl peptidase/L-asparaginase-like protein (Ntn-hydrolase superfamily)
MAIPADKYTLIGCGAYADDAVDGRGSVICIDKNGRAGYAFNTSFMARVLADETGIVEIGIKPA